MELYKNYCILELESREGLKPIFVNIHWFVFIRFLNTLLCFGSWNCRLKLAEVDNSDNFIYFSMVIKFSHINLGLCWLSEDVLLLALRWLHLGGKIKSKFWEIYFGAGGRWGKKTNGSWYQNKKIICKLASRKILQLKQKFPSGTFSWRISWSQEYDAKTLWIWNSPVNVANG
jgi:hypothetical protein